jgi:hypothetical protein
VIRWSDGGISARVAEFPQCAWFANAACPPEFELRLDMGLRLSYFRSFDGTPGLARRISNIPFCSASARLDSQVSDGLWTGRKRQTARQIDGDPVRGSRQDARLAAVLLSNGDRAADIAEARVWLDQVRDNVKDSDDKELSLVWDLAHGVCLALSVQVRQSQEFFQDMLRNVPDNERAKEALAAFSR